MTNVWMYLLTTLSGILVLSMIGLFFFFRKWTDRLVRDINQRDTEIETRSRRFETLLHEELSRQRMETAVLAKDSRQELSRGLQNISDSLLKRTAEHAAMQKDLLTAFSKQLYHLTRVNEQKLETLKDTVDRQLTALREENSRKLEQMREVVDDTLQNVLEKRLDASFAQVSTRLEQVYKGLGEMRSLATGVGDLKRVLTNVKTRGIWGETRLSQILEQILAPEQYAENVETRRNSGERVEFAIRLPGPGGEKDRPVWLPVDAKFPQEDYQRLMDAREAADRSSVIKHTRNLEIRIKTEAKQIHRKYIDPPNTTDFAILFLPVEGLFAEVLRIAGLCDFLQREYRIVVAGPTTMAALLNSLQMGFRTLAIERRSSEVWELLGRVRTEFGKFGTVLVKTRTKLKEAADTIDKAEIRTRAIERRLRKVGELSEN